MVEKEGVPFTIQGPTPTHYSEGGAVVKKIGSSIIDLHFTQPSQLGELLCKNFYSAFISIYVKRYSGGGKGGQGGSGGTLQRHATFDGSLEKLMASSSHMKDGNSVEEVVCGRFRRIPSASGGGRGKSVLIDLSERPWEYCTSKRLMPWPHFELGSQDSFSIQATESLVEWKDVLIMRLVIHQPSSVWKHFTVDDIHIFRNLPRRFNLDDKTLQNDGDGRLATLTANTLRMLGGMTVEPEPDKLDSRK